MSVIDSLKIQCTTLVHLVAHNHIFLLKNPHYWLQIELKLFFELRRLLECIVRGIPKKCNSHKARKIIIRFFQYIVRGKNTNIFISTKSYRNEIFSIIFNKKNSFDFHFKQQGRRYKNSGF